MTNDQELFAAIRALPHMAITKADGEYRITYRLASIALADQRQHSADWHRITPSGWPSVAYYTNDRANVLGTAKSLSAQMVRLLDRVTSKEAGR
ncbi:hypothetical protein ACFSUK_02370 [Sphingobium scionense]|uniref:Uncharacterized protein n=2 Tax=Sphingomonadaceae TaxID=41297 RepID=A0A1L4A098_9SPHN|nr:MULTISPECIES: hypothetical protein [Sphingomonadaceae]API61296.1 hypothetical protein BSL82_17790 [Tardibacter chloracetimidivorans]MBB4151510.1 hypothetical protein [Sphingobium scionense]